MITEPPGDIPTNRSALISLVAAILTLLSFCTAVVPIPFTGYVCFPATTIFGLVALIIGLISLWQIRSSRESGRGYALIGVGVGGLTILVALCATSVGILLFPKILNLFRQYLK